MSVKELFGLENCNISDYEVMGKLREAFIHNMEEIDFIDNQGNTVRVYLPQMKFDPFMYIDAG
ncbi:hypothetical protein GF336_02725 [Candidatus Woesearchaeota archaeon]|nr:hypothetical protein [Candidatus Woesearchaeota archaeon]